MKKILGITLFMAAAAIFGSCDKTEDYIDFKSEIQVREIRGVKFDSASGVVTSTLGYTHPFDIYQGESVFVYFLEGTQNGANGVQTPVWAPLPVNYYIDVVNNGVQSRAGLEYSFAFGASEVFLTARSFEGLNLFRNVRQDDGSNISYTDGLTFRVVYIPANDPRPFSAASMSSVEKSSLSSSEESSIPSYEELSKKYNLDNVKVQYMSPSQDK